MIRWIQPGALYGLILAVLPLLIHLLRTRRADRIQFPSIRFVQPSIAAAVRVRAPTDWLLLLVRTGVIVAGVGAAAQPVWLTRSRLDGWNSRIARAIVVDVSRSMRIPTSDGRLAADAAEEAATAEKAGAVAAARFDGVALASELGRAVRWLQDAPPARLEIVIISDAQQGALDGFEVSLVPPDIGIRLVAVGSEVDERVVNGVDRFGGAGVAQRSQMLTLSRDTTSVTIQERAGEEPGIRFLAAPEHRPELDRLLRAVALAGAPSSSRQERLAFWFAGANEAVAAARPVTRTWMLRTLVRMQHDEQIGRLASRERGITTPARNDFSSLSLAIWSVIARDATGNPLVLAAEVDEELTVVSGTRPSTLLAAAVVQGALNARHGSLDDPEAEPARISRALLREWTRAPGSVGTHAWRRVEESDARWFWLLAAALLLTEGWLRSRPTLMRQTGVRRAA